MGCEPLPPQPRRRRPVISVFKRLSAMTRAYAYHCDPRVAAANVISLLVASNQPFYPLYIFWLVSSDITAAWFTFLSTPFFVAVPAVARWNDAAGRALLPLTGIGNTMLSAWLFGTASARSVRGNRASAVSPAGTCRRPRDYRARLRRFPSIARCLCSPAHAVQCGAIRRPGAVKRNERRHAHRLRRHTVLGDSG